MLLLSDLFYFCWTGTVPTLNPSAFSFPPHTTHECQPLDVGLFGPLKRHWQQACHSFYRKNTTQVISKYNFCQVFKDAWLNAILPANVFAGFKKAGVYPFNPKAVPVRQQSEDHDNDANNGKLHSHTHTWQTSLNIQSQISLLRKRASRNGHPPPPPTPPEIKQ